MGVLSSQISGLTVTEKYELLDALWRDIESQALALSDDQAPELDRRVARYRQDASVAVLWEQVKGELFKQ